MGKLMFKHQPGVVVLIVVTILAWAATTVICCLGNPLLPRAQGLFSQKIALVTYFTDIEPPIWVHWALWALTYFWQLTWLIYGLSTICRYGTQGYLYYSPEIVPFTVYALFILTQIFHTAYIFLWANGYYGYGVIMVALLAFVLYWCMYIMFTKLRQMARQLDEYLLRKDIFMSIGFVHNGLACYAATASFVTIFLFCDILVNLLNADIEFARTICYVIISIETCIWFFLDICLFDTYCRYTVSPYIVFIITMVGLVIKARPTLENILERNVLFCVLLLAVCAIMLFVKLIALYRKPIYVTTVRRESNKEYRFPKKNGKNKSTPKENVLIGDSPLIEMSESRSETPEKGPEMIETTAEDTDDVARYAYDNTGAVTTDINREHVVPEAAGASYQDEDPPVTNVDHVIVHDTVAVANGHS